MENSLYQDEIKGYTEDIIVKIKNDFDENNQIIKEDIFEPFPLNYYCHICKIKFIDYKTHIKTKLHMKNSKEINFENIKETFKRIVKCKKNENII